MKAAVQRKVKEGSGDTQTDSKNLDMAWAIPGTDTEAPSKDDEGSSQATTSTEESDEVEQPIPNAASQSESVERIGKAEQSVPDAGSQSESPTETEEERIEREIREIEENEQLENEKQQRYEAERAKRLVQEKADYAKSDAGIAEARALKDAEAEAEQIEEARAAKAEKEQAQEDAHQSAEALAESERAEGDDAVSREKSVEGSGLNTPAESEVSQSATAASLVSGLRRLVSSQGTGTSTPASDDSMGPVKSAMKKPISLARLQTAGPTTPSAQQLALQSAQLVRDISSIEYPKDVKPPESVGDSTTDIVLHRYDTDFLLQFRIVCTSKPSLDWDKRLKEAMGEGSDSARTPSNRSGHPTSSRQPSHRGNNPFQGGAMGSFGQPSAPGPRGTTSEERFAMSNRPAPRSGMGTPGVSFAAMPRGGSGSGPVSRNPSTASFGMGAGITPPSPRRTQAGRHDSNKNPSRGGRKHDGGDAKSMPLTVGQEFKPLAPSASGWKPRSVGAAAQMAGPTPGDNKILQPDEVQRKVKSNLNKMTPENFEKISGQILEIAAQSKHEADGRTLRQVIQLTFEKATDEAHWAPMYAQFALKMLQLVDSGIQDAGVTDKEGKPLKGGPLFRKYLLNRCQEEFEVGRKVDDSGKTPGQSDEAVMLSDEYYIAAAAKRRSLGLVRFIGEMFKLSMLSSRIMHECLTRLLEFENLPDEAEIEGLCNLLKTVGYALDDDKGKTRMDQYFQRIQNVMNMPELPSRLHYMLLDIVDLRRKRWHGKDVNKGPKTLQEIHEEVLPKLPSHLFFCSLEVYADIHVSYRPKSKLVRKKLNDSVRTRRSATLVETGDTKGKADSPSHLRWIIVEQP